MTRFVLRLLLWEAVARCRNHRTSKLPLPAFFLMVLGFLNVLSSNTSLNGCSFAHKPTLFGWVAHALRARYDASTMPSVMKDMHGQELGT